MFILTIFVYLWNNNKQIKKSWKIIQEFEKKSKAGRELFRVTWYLIMSHELARCGPEFFVHCHYIIFIHGDYYFKTDRELDRVARFNHTIRNMECSFLKVWRMVWLITVHWQYTVLVPLTFRRLLRSAR